MRRIPTVAIAINNVVIKVKSNVSSKKPFKHMGGRYQILVKLSRKCHNTTTRINHWTERTRLFYVSSQSFSHFERDCAL